MSESVPRPDPNLAGMFVWKTLALVLAAKLEGVIGQQENPTDQKPEADDEGGDHDAAPASIFPETTRAATDGDRSGGSSENVAVELDCGVAERVAVVRPERLHRSASLRGLRMELEGSVVTPPSPPEEQENRLGQACHAV